MTDDELEIYDACTADTLQNGDIIKYEGIFFQIVYVEDAGTEIKVTGLSLEWEEELDGILEPDEVLSLYKFKD